MKTYNSETYIIPSFVKSRPKTKIVCTLGPSTKSIPSIKQLIKNGMSVARINLSHGNIKEHIKLIKNARTASKEINFPLAILADIPGPKYRINVIDSKDIDLQNGSTIHLFNDENKKFKKQHNIWPIGFTENLKIGYPF